MSLGNRYITALSKKYEAEMAEAEANLALYFSNSNLAAIGEHSDLMEEQDKWIEKYTNAKDKLETLKSLNFDDDLNKRSERINS
jgi:predicted adenine nucleotide alpha hydrolase (AANH) superfamily ATPase